MKKILTLLTLSSLAILAGCSSAELPTNTNETGEANTNTQVVVANTNSDSNTNEVVNENSNTNSDSDADEVDTSDWLRYENNQIGISFDYPVNGQEVRFDYTDCSKVVCDSTSGSSYNVALIKEDGSMNYSIAGASTADFAAGRDLVFYDVALFRQEGSDYFAVLTEEIEFSIQPLKTFNYPLGQVIVYPISALPSYPQLLDARPERKDDRIAIYNFNEEIEDFQSISILLTPEMIDQDIERIFDSVSKL